ncbi:hypothetical protein B5P44_00245 [Mycobacterium sp. CBMA 213]|nr:hypothetical protein [Mycolicibacterium sp. CBMA 335]MUM03252.1 hypothetical protein [Mycolicibacterium sp. CBMA 213]
MSVGAAGATGITGPAGPPGAAGGVVGATGGTVCCSSLPALGSPVALPRLSATVKVSAADANVCAVRSIFWTACFISAVESLILLALTWLALNGIKPDVELLISCRFMRFTWRNAW